MLSKKKNKVTPISKLDPTSLENLAHLVKRLSVQIEDLENWKEELNQQTTVNKSTDKQHSLEHDNTALQTFDTLNPSPEEIGNIRQFSVSPGAAPNYTLIDPWASYVPQNYAALIHKLEAMENPQNCPKKCCKSMEVVSSADGVPWPKPFEPFQTQSNGYLDDNTQNSSQILDTQYTHWCTLLRCLPLMDPVTSAHVKTVGLFAMREILKCKANQKREYKQCVEVTPTKLRESLSHLSYYEKIPVKSAIPIAAQDIPPWMTKSETKVELDALPGPPVPPKESETLFTPTPSGLSSPVFYRKRFQKWIKSRKANVKTNTDTSTTPLAQSQAFKKVGSWFF